MSDRNRKGRAWGIIGDQKVVKLRRERGCPERKKDVHGTRGGDIGIQEKRTLYIDDI